MKSSFEIIGYCSFALSILWLLGFASPSPAATARGMEMTESANCCLSCQKEDCCTCTSDLNCCQKKNCCTCTRELRRVLWGGGTTLAALVLSLGRWYLTDFHLKKREIIPLFPKVSFLRIFWTFVGGVLLPQIFMSFVLSSALCATVLQQRVIPKENKEKRRIAKRLSAMVVWIPVYIECSKAFFNKHKSLREFFPGHELAPGTQDALVLYSKCGNVKQKINVANNSGSGGSCCSSCEEEKDKQYILCSQDWDGKNRLWKEAMLNTDGVLPRIEELNTIESRTKLECVGVIIQALGYLVSILSRLAAGNRAAITPLEIISAWISIVLLVQLVAIPQLVTFCNKGMCLHLPPEKFMELVNYYERRKEQQNDIDLTFKTVWLFVLCLFFQFTLFLVLIPALVYEYYRLPHSALSLASLFLFTILSGIGIISFVLTLIFPAQEVLFVFSAFPGIRRDQPAATTRNKLSSCTDYTPVISSILLLVGLSAYILAIADTVLNWHRFNARDCYFSNFVIPHVGS